MHNNYHFLSALAEELNNKITGAELLECFSQNRDELIIGFSISPEEDFFVKAHLSNTFSCLSFYDDFARAKRNSVDLFKSWIGLKVKKVYIHDNERALSIYLSNRETITFKLFGRFSNIIHFSKSGDVIKIFNSQYESDADLQLESLHRPINQTKKLFDNEGVGVCYPTLSKEMKQKSATWDDAQALLQELSLKKYYLVHDDKISLSMFSCASVVKSYDSALVAITDYFHEYIKVFSLKTERDKATREITSKIKGTKKYITQNSSKLIELQGGVSYKQIADIIMANLYQIPEHAEEVELFNFYDDNQLKIRLKKHLSPQKNAENFYRKEKKFGVQLEKLTQNIEGAKERLVKFEQLLEDLSYINNVKTLRKLLDDNGFTKKEKEKQEDELFKTYQFMNYTIYVGRNSKNNDVLTLKYAHKDDYWLHAKDVPGSHVVVKFQSGKDIPKLVLEKAAELAAYYSKRKNDTLCPVTVTRKKYVRKPKGVPAGAVFVEREEVLLVEPKENI